MQPRHRTAGSRLLHAGRLERIDRAGRTASPSPPRPGPHRKHVPQLGSSGWAPLEVMRTAVRPSKGSGSSRVPRRGLESPHARLESRGGGGGARRRRAARRPRARLRRGERRPCVRAAADRRIHPGRLPRRDGRVPGRDARLEARVRVRREPRARAALAPGDRGALRPRRRPAARRHGRTYITAIRTAAASAVATRALAREDSSVFAVLGAGVQGREHLEVVPRVGDFREIRVASRTRDHAEDAAAACGA